MAAAAAVSAICSVMFAAGTLDRVVARNPISLRTVQKKQLRQDATAGW
jgi:hypothetical protein